MRFLYFYLMGDQPDAVRAAAPEHASYWRGMGLANYLGGPFADRSGELTVIFSPDPIHLEDGRIVATARPASEDAPPSLLSSGREFWIRSRAPNSRMAEFFAKGRNLCESVYENERLEAQINSYVLITITSEGARYRHVSRTHCKQQAKVLIRGSASRFSLGGCLFGS